MSPPGVWTLPRAPQESDGRAPGYDQSPIPLNLPPQVFYCVKFHPGDDRQNVFMSGCQDKKIYQFDTDTGEHVSAYIQGSRSQGAVAALCVWQRLQGVMDDIGIVKQSTIYSELRAAAGIFARRCRCALPLLQLPDPHWR